MSTAVDRELTVIIPTLNRAEQLACCLLALKQQTLAPERFDVVIVDNGSSPSQLADVQRAAATAPFRTTVLIEPKRGPAAARNRGIEAARGARILFLGDDIVASRPLLAEHLAAAKGREDCAILGFTDWAPDLPVTPFMRYLAPDRGPQFRYATIRDPNHCGYQFFYTSNISLARHWLDLERFDEEYPYAVLEDADLGYRLEKRGLRIVFHRPALAWHDHVIRFWEFVVRMERLGESMVRFAQKYPELRADEGLIPCEAHRTRLGRRRRLHNALLTRMIAAADLAGIALPQRWYERVLEYRFVESYFSALDRRP
ncbi:MAG: glycosyltransferase [Candidatus Sumerlaeia bacterium]|nr:glycosyltransferase [Candidatus Sumerlaeia bacterium]